MGIKLGDISPLAGAITGKGMFGRGLGAANRVLGPMAGIASRMAEAAQKRNARRAVVEAEMERRAGMRGRPMVEDAMLIAEAPAGAMMRKGGKVKTKKMAKGGSTASKRADGCAIKGKTKGRFV
jgi:hypothetical protein